MTLQTFHSLKNLNSQEWNLLGSPDFPFSSYQFLTSLEDGHCLGDRTGWSPLYLTAWKQQELIGALPLYVKSNSYGEYIFDFNWAQAHESCHVEYYPKLLAAIPFTPATGPKILLKQGLDSEQRRAVSQELIKLSQSLLQTMKMSSLHALFITEDEIQEFRSANFMIRHSFQYHWKNENYENFDGFLQSLRAKRRKEVKRERAQVLQGGVQIQRLTGDQLKSQHAELMYRFYLDTIHKMGGFSYLTLDFFKMVFEKMKAQILLVLALDSEGHEVAGALNFYGSKTLYGRYWGCLDQYKALHFEVCYYQGIEFAIEKNLKLFEAGAQGEHKFQRGFLPNLTYSAHQIQEPRLGQAIRDFVDLEKKDLQRLFNQYEEHSPFSRDPLAKADPKE